jgi:hypothetical protein
MAEVTLEGSTYLTEERNGSKGQNRDDANSAWKKLNIEFFQPFIIYAYGT